MGPDYLHGTQKVTGVLSTWSPFGSCVAGAAGPRGYWSQKCDVLFNYVAPLGRPPGGCAPLASAGILRVPAGVVATFQASKINPAGVAGGGRASALDRQSKRHSGEPGKPAGYPGKRGAQDSPLVFCIDCFFSAGNLQA